MRSIGATGRTIESIANGFDAGLFALATDLRDRAIAGEQAARHRGYRPPSSLLVRFVAVPKLWNGICLACEERRIELHGLSEERKRLLDQRDDILREREQMANEIPLMKRRLADVIQRSIRTNGSSLNKPRSLRTHPD